MIVLLLVLIIFILFLYLTSVVIVMVMDWGICERGRVWFLGCLWDAKL
jgi:hypothetical protein